MVTNGHFLDVFIYGVDPIQLTVQCDGKKDNSGYLSHWWLVVLLPEIQKAHREKEEWICRGIKGSSWTDWV